MFKVTVEPIGNVAEHPFDVNMVQFIPAGTDTIVARVHATSLRVCPWLGLKVATHVASEPRVIVVAAFVPEHTPLQPVKLEPGPGLAVRVTIAPFTNNAEHAPLAQFRVPGLEVTVPVPCTCTVNAGA